MKYQLIEGCALYNTLYVSSACEDEAVKKSTIFSRFTEEKDLEGMLFCIPNILVDSMCQQPVHNQGRHLDSVYFLLLCGTDNNFFFHT